jgi:large subunit ribosomal protein L18
MMMAKATGPVYNVPFKRRRQGLTNYAKRLALVKSGRVRMVVRKSLKGVSVQFIQFGAKGDATLAAASSRELSKYGWSARSNLPTAYLTAALAAKRASKKGVADFVLDIGLSTASKNALPFAAAKGAVDAGLKANLSKDAVAEARIRGEHIAGYAAKVKGTAKYEKLFGAYIREGVQPEKLPEKFDSAKAAVMKEGA